jgi:hypothetical protein
MTTRERRAIDWKLQLHKTRTIRQGPQDKDHKTRTTHTHTHTHLLGTVVLVLWTTRQGPQDKDHEIRTTKQEGVPPNKKVLFVWIGQVWWSCLVVQTRTTGPEALPDKDLRTRGYLRSTPTLGPQVQRPNGYDSGSRSAWLIGLEVGGGFLAQCVVDWLGGGRRISSKSRFSRGCGFSLVEASLVSTIFSVDAQRAPAARRPPCRLSVL